MNDTLINFLLSVATSVAGLKILELVITRFFSAKDKNVDNTIAWRNELQTEIKRLSDRVEYLESQVNDWKNKYYLLFEEHTMLNVAHQGLQRQYDELEKSYTSIQLEVDSLRRQRRGDR